MQTKDLTPEYILEVSNMPIIEIHSGGQTGADQGGLAAAITLGLKTSGVAPKGYRTQAGNAAWLRGLGLVEHSSPRYPPRTKENVSNTDGTLVFGNIKSAGSSLTLRYAIELNKTYFYMWWKPGEPIPDAHYFRQWLKDNDIKKLNVAGNREESAPGIFQATRDFLVEALKEEVGDGLD